MFGLRGGVSGLSVRLSLFLIVSLFVHEFCVHCVSGCGDVAARIDQWVFPFCKPFEFDAAASANLRGRAQ